MKIARVLVTKKCEKDCKDCCNRHIGILYKANYIKDLKPLRPYDAICITGGEPLLNFVRTQEILLELKKDKPDRPVYLYTALFTPLMWYLFNIIDGLHYTLHYPLTCEDHTNFVNLQRLMQRMKDRRQLVRLSFRLYIDNRISVPIEVKPNLWSRVEIKPWLKECPLPKDETLFILDEKYLC